MIVKNYKDNHMEIILTRDDQGKHYVTRFAEDMPPEFHCLGDLESALDVFDELFEEIK